MNGIQARGPGLLLFGVPRAFEGEVAVAQRNAIGSWVRLVAPTSVALLGDDAGVAEAAAELGAVHIADIAKSRSGAPLLDSVMQAVRSRFGANVLCYLNADVIVIGDLAAVLGKVAEGLDRYLVVARRVDTDLGGTVDFVDGWEAGVLLRARESGKTALGAAGSDLFAFAGGTFEDVPPLAIGRCAWDNWMMAEALRRGAALVDATACLTLVHQPHGYEHAGVRGRGIAALRELSRTPEGRRNLELAGGPAALRTVDDATHQVVPGPDGPMLVTVALPRRLASSARRLSSTARYHASELKRRAGRAAG